MLNHTLLIQNEKKSLTDIAASIEKLNENVTEKMEENSEQVTKLSEKMNESTERVTKLITEVQDDVKQIKESSKARDEEIAKIK